MVARDGARGGQNTADMVVGSSRSEPSSAAAPLPALICSQITPSNPAPVAPRVVVVATSAEAPSCSNACAPRAAPGTTHTTAPSERPLRDSGLATRGGTGAGEVWKAGWAARDSRDRGTGPFHPAPVGEPTAPDRAWVAGAADARARRLAISLACLPPSAARGSLSVAADPGGATTWSSCPRSTWTPRRRACSRWWPSAGSSSTTAGPTAACLASRFSAAAMACGGTSWRCGSPTAAVAQELLLPLGEHQLGGDLARAAEDILVRVPLRAAQAAAEGMNRGAWSMS